MKRLLLILALLLSPSWLHAQAAMLPYVEGGMFDANGNPLASGFICTTLSGGTTNVATYPTAADAAAGTNANTNPVTLDSAGRANIFIGPGLYRVVILNAVGTGSSSCNGTSTGSAIKTVDGVVGGVGRATVNCSVYAGATASVKIAACISALPSTGGTADARDIQGAQTWSTDPFSGVTKPVDFLCGATTSTVSATTTTVPSVHSVYGQGCVFSINNGITFTVNGSMKGSSLSQHFAGTGMTTPGLAMGSLARNEIYPQYWGALEDGTTDDVTALKAAFAIPKAHVFLLPGAYYSGSGLTAPCSGSIEGLGNANAININFAATVAKAFPLDPCTANGSNGPTFLAHFTINATAPSTASALGIVFGDTGIISGLTVIDVIGSGWSATGGIACDLRDVEHFVMTSLVCTGKIGMRLLGSTVDLPQVGTFNGGRFASSGDGNILISSATDMTFIGTDIESGTNYGADLLCIANRYIRQIKFDHPRFEGNAQGGGTLYQFRIDCNGVSGADASGISLIAPDFVGAADPGKDILIDGDGIVNFSIDKPRLRQSGIGTPRIYIQHSAQGWWSLGAEVAVNAMVSNTSANAFGDVEVLAGVDITGRTYIDKSGYSVSVIANTNGYAAVVVATTAGVSLPMLLHTTKAPFVFTTDNGPVPETASTNNGGQTVQLVATTAMTVIADSFATPGRFGARRANGTSFAPTAVTTGQQIGILFGSGYTGSNYVPYTAGPSVRFLTREDWSGTQVGSNIEFWTATAGATAALRRAFVQDGLVVGSGTDLGIGGIVASGQVVFSGLTSAGAQDYVCSNTSTGELVQGTAPCTASSERYKHDFADLGANGYSALNTVLKLHTYSYIRNDHPEIGRQVGLKAEDAYKIDPRIVALDEKGRPDRIRYDTYDAIMTKAIQELTFRVKHLETQHK